MDLRGVIFDLDGTLADTLPVCFAAFRRAFGAFTGREFTNAEIEALFGPSEEGSLQRVVPEAHWDDALACFLEEYERAHTLCTAPFAGLTEVLHWLGEQEVRLAIVTGKGAHSAAISLRHLGISSYFSAVETGSSQGGIKPQAIQKVVTQWNLPAASVAYVGDVPSDMTAARTAGVIPLGAAWAATADYDRLEHMTPHAAFRTVEEFADWLRQQSFL